MPNESLYSCVYVTVFCVMPIIPLTLLPYSGKKFLINESFYPSEQKPKRYRLNPVSCGGRQRNQLRVVYVFD